MMNVLLLTLYSAAETERLPTLLAFLDAQATTIAGLNISICSLSEESCFNVPWQYG